MTGHILKLGVVAHAYDARTWRLGYEDHNEFEANPGYSWNMTAA